MKPPIRLCCSTIYVDEAIKKALRIEKKTQKSTTHIATQYNDDATQVYRE